MRERKKRKSHIVRNLVLTLLLVTMTIAVALGVLRFLYPKRKLIGHWYTDIDVTSEVSEHISDWIRAAAMGGQTDVSAYMDSLGIRRIYTFKPDGTWSVAVDRESYDQCTEAAYDAMSAALKDLICRRFEASGKGTIDEAGAEKLMTDLLGMSVKDYLKEFGPDIMPDIADLEAEYNRNGIYTADRQYIIIDEKTTYEYMVNGRMLAIGSTESDEGNIILTRTLDTAEKQGEEETVTTSGLSVSDIFAPVHDICDIYDLSKVSAAGTAKHRILENLTVKVGGGSKGSVRTIHYDYQNNRYVSLRDMAAVLSGSTAEFSPSISTSEIIITRGKEYSPVGGENTPFAVRTFDDEGEETDTENESTEQEDAAYAEADSDNADDSASEDEAAELSDDDYVYNTRNLSATKMTVDDREVRYYTLIGTNDAGNTDAFMSITDLAMILNVDMSIEDGNLYIDPSKDFKADLIALKNEGFYTEVRSALVGDASTSEIFASNDEDTGVAIASTTKLMNYLCVMDAVTAGEISLSDVVSVSYRAEILSGTADGVIPMKQGDTFTVEELLYGMLLPSSNECALALAEHIAGSEEAYVQRMNAKALELGLSDATIFYNCHGLPVYSDNIVTSKLQNQMSAKDMFALASYILAVYPQVTDITSTREYSFTSREYSVKNLNPMLYNLDNVIGLKTGTTNMAGSSLVSAMKVNDASGAEHIIVAVEFGAEDGVTRNTVSELMLRYGQSVVAEKNAGGSDAALSHKLKNGANIPTTAEGLIRLLLSA